MHTPFELSKFGPQKRLRKGVVLSCETCRREFYVFPARIAQVQKFGYRIRFCSNKCYRKDGEHNPFHGGKHSIESRLKMKNHPNRHKFKPGKENPNFVRFGADFEPITAWNWRARLIRKDSRCARCGYYEHPQILELHHKDRNRRNNARDNIQLLCPNCHSLDHYLAKDGKWRALKKIS